MDPFDQVDLKGLKPVDSPSKLAVFTNKEEAKPNEYVAKPTEEVIRDQAQRRSRPKSSVRSPPKQESLQSKRHDNCSPPEVSAESHRSKRSRDSVRGDLRRSPDRKQSKLSHQPEERKRQSSRDQPSNKPIQEKKEQSPPQANTKKEPSATVGGKWRLNDQEVRSLIESKYNPEKTIINEEQTLE